MSSIRSKSTSTACDFERFYEGWMARQEHYLDELLSTQERATDVQATDLNDLITRVLAHYQEYFEEKSRVFEQNVFLLFSTPWHTNLEISFSWIAGFKPALAYGLISSCTDDLTEDQRRRVKQLREETRVEERAVENKKASIQESIAAPPLLGILRQRGKPNGVVVVEEEAALGALKKGVEEVVVAADVLRRTTVLKVMEVLNPVQKIRFLVGAMLLQKKIRNWGLKDK